MEGGWTVEARQLRGEGGTQIVIVNTYNCSDMTSFPYLTIILMFKFTHVLEGDKIGPVIK